MKNWTYFETRILSVEKEVNNTNFNAYFKSANRGDFQWNPIDIDDWTGRVLSEECTYKGQGVNVIVSGCKGDYTIEIDKFNS